MIWWIVAGVVVVALVALAWWSSGRKPGVIPAKRGTSGTGASEAHEAGGIAGRRAGGPPVAG
jgi:hypothetical protein